MIADGWTFEKDGAAQGDSLFNTTFARDIYLRAKPDMAGRVTVPILWGKNGHDRI